MTILPKCLYLLQAVPIHIPAGYFRQVHSAFIAFIWTRKRPRINKKIHSLQKQNGGLAMPDIRTYYHAIHLCRLIDWCRHRETKLWPQLEQAQSETPLHRVPCCYSALPAKCQTSTPDRQHHQNMCTTDLPNFSLILELTPTPYTG